MKILFAIKGVHNLAGGAERVVCQVASAMAERGHETILLSFDQEQAVPFYHLSKSVETIYLGIGSVTRKTSPALFLRRIMKLRKAVLEREPDMVVAFMHSMFIPMGFALIGTGIPLIASEHTVPLHYSDKRHQFLLFESTISRYDAITVLSKDIISLYPPKIRSKMTVIPNPVMIPKRQSPVYESSISNNTILSVGRLDANKNHQTLIKAFSQISVDFPQWNLKIVGEGGLRNDLEQMVASSQLMDRISLPGISHDISDEYHNSKILAIPSVYEGFSLVLAEAMACGLPCIGFSDCSGVNELIRSDYDGLLVGGGERISLLADALRRLMENSELRKKLGANARKSIAERFDSLQIFSLWDTLFRDVLYRRRQRGKGGDSSSRRGIK